MKKEIFVNIMGSIRKMAKERIRFIYTNIVCMILIIILNFSYDIYLRVLTQKINYMNIWSSVPNLFTIAWCFVFLSIFLMLPLRAGKIIFVLGEGILFTYTIGQYIYWRVFESFFRVSDMLVAKEGAEFSEVIWKYIDKWVVLYLVFFLF